LRTFSCRGCFVVCGSGAPTGSVRKRAWFTALTAICSCTRAAAAAPLLAAVLPRDKRLVRSVRSVSRFAFRLPRFAALLPSFVSRTVGTFVWFRFAIARWRPYIQVSVLGCNGSAFCCCRTRLLVLRVTVLDTLLIYLTLDMFRISPYAFITVQQPCVPHTLFILSSAAGHNVHITCCCVPGYWLAGHLLSRSVSLVPPPHLHLLYSANAVDVRVCRAFAVAAPRLYIPATFVHHVLPLRTATLPARSLPLTLRVQATCPPCCSRTARHAYIAVHAQRHALYTTTV